MATSGGFSVRRTLPSAHRQMVGPFTLLDQAVPTELLIYREVRCSAAPPIGLATVWYLQEGRSFTATASPASSRSCLACELDDGGPEGCVFQRARKEDLQSAHDRLQTWVVLHERHEEAPPTLANVRHQSLRQDILCTLELVLGCRSTRPMNSAGLGSWRAPSRSAATYSSRASLSCSAPAKD